MEVADLEARLEALADEAVAALAQVTTIQDAEQTKNRFIGRKGEVAELMKGIGALPNDQKPLAGKASNRAKGRIEQAHDVRVEAIKRANLERRLANEAIDVTLPARPVARRGAHPLKQVEAELRAIFHDMGYAVADGPELEEDFYNFEALNFPPDHPARDMQDTYFLDRGRVLRTHTSPIQIRTMLAYEPPIAVIAPGRTYRCDNDVTHSPVFHQIEGLLVDEGVTFADLKGTLNHFAQACFGPGTRTRFRASYFPFTEPSAEVDIGCIFCGGEGCRVCSHTGWLEILGCGMVDPNVFRHVGIDPERYSGFAFGMGVERIAMLKLRINDIRLFYENDVRFLGQFDG